MLKAVFFDFDGVIHNTFDFHRNKVTEFTGIDLSEDEYKDMHNGNFYDHKINKLKGVNWSAYPKYIHAEHSKLEMEQEIKEALCALHKRYRLFIVSSGGGPRIVDYLKNNGVDQLFTEVFQKLRNSSIYSQSTNSLLMRVFLSPTHSATFSKRMR